MDAVSVTLQVWPPVPAVQRAQRNNLPNTGRSLHRDCEPTRLSERRCHQFVGHQHSTGRITALLHPGIRVPQNIHIETGLIVIPVSSEYQCRKETLFRAVTSSNFCSNVFWLCFEASATYSNLRDSLLMSLSLAASTRFCFYLVADSYCSNSNRLITLSFDSEFRVSRNAKFCFL